MKKRIKTGIITALAAIFFLQTIAGAPALAAGSITSSIAEATVMQQPAKPAVTLEQAIGIAKSNFAVPDKYSEFYSSYQTNNDQQVWILRWADPGGRLGEFYVQVDAANGDIVSMNTWDYSSQSDNNVVVPTITQEGAQEIATNLVKKLLGERAAQMQIISGKDQLVTLGNYGPMSYTVQYQRILNQISFYDNGVTVQIAGNDGHIISYNLKWTKTEVAEPQNIINLEQARQAFRTNGMLKLQYWMPSLIRPLTMGEKANAKLIYQLIGQNKGAIDAYTGMPLKLAEGEWLAGDQGYGGMGDNKSSSEASQAVQITPQEQKEIELNARLLSREDAQETVRCLVGIPDNLTLRSASLNRDWQNIENSNWSFDWYDAGMDQTTEMKSVMPADTVLSKLQYMYARVDAVTGEMLNFNVGYPYSENNPSKISRLEAQKIAEDFIKKASPARFNQIKLVEENNQDVKQPSEDSGMFYFNYQRMVNQIEFPGNSINVSVESISGRIQGYDVNWSNVVLPETNGVLSPEKAADYYMQALPLTLSYVRVYRNGLAGEIRLVYLPVASNNNLFTYPILDAKTGTLLDYQGQPLEQTPKPYHFTDIEGVDGAAEIAVLGQAGLFGDFGVAFRPETKITIGSLLRAMYLNRYGVYNNASLTDAEIMAKAKEQGWLKEDVYPDESIDREFLAKVLLRYSHWDKVAELKGIFKLNYRDADLINQDALGYVAIASQTGILKSNGDMLYPHQAVSRAEAAGAFFRALSWQN